MQKKWKRLISLLLAFCMVLGMMPSLKVSAKMAADMTEAEAFDAGLDVYVAWSNYIDAYRDVVTDPVTAIMNDSTSAFNRLFKQIYPDGVENSDVLAEAERWLKDFYNAENEFSRVESELLMSLLLSCVLYTGGVDDYSSLEDQVSNVLKNGLDAYEKVEETLLEYDDSIDIPQLELSGMGEFTFGILTDLAFGAIEEGKNYKEAIETAAKYDTIRSAAASDIDILREFESQGFLGRYVRAYTTAYDQLWETGESSFKEMLIKQNVNFNDMFSDMLGTAVDAGLESAAASATSGFIGGVVAVGQGILGGFELFNIFEGAWKTSGDLLFGQSAMKKADLTLFYLDSVRKMFYHGYQDAYQDFRGEPTEKNAKRLNTYARLMYNVFAASEMYVAQINDTYAKDGIFNAEWMHKIPGGIDPKLSDLAVRQSSTNRQRRENYLVTAYAGFVNFAENSTYRINLNLNGGTFAVAEQLGFHQDIVKLSKIKTINQNIPNGIPVRTGYEFLGWSTDPNASVGDRRYAPGSSYSTDKDLNLYAIWKKVYTISYRGNGGGSVPSAHKNLGLVSSKWPAWEDHTFLGWSESSTYREGDRLYAPGSVIDQNGNKILYAIWRREPYLVTYDYNDNSADIVDQISIPAEDPTYYTVADTRKDPGRFKGWMIPDPNGHYWWTNGSWDNGKVSIVQPGETLTLTGNLEFYAKWDYYVHYFNGEIAVAHDTVANTGVYELRDALPSQNGRAFKTWKVSSADGSFAYYEPGETIYLQSDMNVYAVWQD